MESSNPMETEALVGEALARSDSSRHLAAAAVSLGELARQAYAGDPAAWARLHKLLYELHERVEPATFAIRQWLASTVYELEERRAIETASCEPPSEEGFSACLISAQRARPGEVHPLARHMFEGQPSRRDIQIYIRHQWYRARTFYRLVADLAARLPLEEAAILYENLMDEVGGGVPARAHPMLFRRLLEHLGIPHDDEPSETDAHVYLNNRTRCVRSADPAWGLGMLFSIELGTPEIHGRIHRMLRRADVPETVCEFHRLHSHVDAEHSRQLLELIARRIRGAEQQQTCLISLVHHRRLAVRYFDRIWGEMQQARPGESS